MDMCRIFNEETQKLDKTNLLNIFMDKQKRHKRVKRELQPEAVNPALNLEDAQRIEAIVDKMYDDLAEKGEKVDYRRGNLSYFLKSKQKKKYAAEKPSRRFNFAPEFLLAPPPTTSPRDLLPPASGKTPRFKLGIVPYFIDSKTYDGQLAEIMMKAFDYIEKATCIRLQRLRERPTDKDSLQNVEWLYITNPAGIKQCVHSNDRTDIKGVQMIVFGYHCMSRGDIVHEIMHVLGFSHEHIRPDRDQYITILWNNIKPGYKKYFESMKSYTIENLPYDYGSILHYPPRAFSKNGQLTILTESGVKIGQREGLSEIDAEKVSMLYSAECVKRNTEYLLKTCPSVARTQPISKPVNVSRKDIDEYYEGRLWTYGIVIYELRKMEFSNEERANIEAVIQHIEKETCIEFIDLNTGPNKSWEQKEIKSRDPTDSKSATIGKHGFHESVNNDEVIDSKTENVPLPYSDFNDDMSDTDYNSISDYSSNLKVENSILYVNETSKKKAHKAAAEELELESDVPNNNQYNRRKVLRQNKNKEGKSRGYTGPSLNLLQTIPTYIIKKKQSPGAERYTQNLLTNKNNDTEPPSPGNSESSGKWRHSSSVIMFERSAEPGCACPTPGLQNNRHTIVKINADCFNSVNDLLHLFVHILGLDHQHNSHDRDSYLHIVWDQLTENVRKDMENKLPPAASLGFAYDYQSVMHFPWLQIKNGRTNIMYPIWNDGWAMGHWQGLSSVDVQKLNLLYNKQCTRRRMLAKEAEAKESAI